LLEVKKRRLRGHPQHNIKTTMADTPEDPPKAQAPNQSVLVPLKLDALGFNGPVCDGKAPDPPTDDEDFNRDLVGAKIAPIEQPNYTFLRLNNSLI
jgi:hypothetical protein